MVGKQETGISPSKQDGENKFFVLFFGAKIYEQNNVQLSADDLGILQQDLTIKDQLIFIQTEYIPAKKGGPLQVQSAERKVFNVNVRIKCLSWLVCDLADKELKG